jgi:Reverse transcriptase (RNA-dependent DNA polymerase)
MSYRFSFDKGELPKAWTHSIVIPIHKSGDRHDLKNYRPISLTSTVCRVFERIISGHIISFLTANKLISTHQFGFMKGRSTKTQLITMLEEWYDAVDKNKCIDAIYIDFKKAFDSVIHNFLLFKLYKIGIRGKLLKWIKSFLSERTFSVKLNNSYSEPKKVLSGVPQGSVLGPLLFLIYINDLEQVIPKNVSMKLYADDIRIYLTYKDINETAILTEALKKTNMWATQWGLSIAEEKTHVLYIGKKNKKMEYKLGNTIMQETDCINDLGVLIDNKLTFNQHINKIIKTSYFRMHQLFRIIKPRSISTWALVYKAYVRSLMEYCTEIWAPKNKKEIVKLEKIQKYFTRKSLVLCRLPKIPYTERLDLFKIPSLQFRRIQADMIFLYKLFHRYTHILPEQLYTLSKRSSRKHNFQILLKRRSNKTLNSFSNRTATIWNRLPSEIVNAGSIKNFKEKFSRWFKESNI